MTEGKKILMKGKVSRYGIYEQRPGGLYETESESFRAEDDGD